ncbi:hypothetical protein GCM10022229_01860 [Luteimonas lutimaris]|uniref:histidine kinase n=2 Tax=Luteimonas lutimaris TaxID=698645 RepID=A0ABP7M5X1_9GAMM
MAILDRDGRWLEVNPAIERMLGRSAAQLAGEAVQACVARDAPALAAGIGTLVAGNARALRMAVVFAHADGREVPATIDIAPMQAGDGSVAWLSVQVTEDAADALAQRLAATEAALASMERLQASFAHGVSHDLRAPLRAIDSFSSLLAEHVGDGLDETARDYLARIRGASARMAGLIDSLLELSRAMRASLRSAPVDLGLLVDWAHAELADADPEAARDARIDVQPGLQALGDERLLRQLLNRLLGNAWKFSRGGPVRIEVDGEQDAGRLVLRVRDHGIGFDVRYADKLFEPFQRLHGPDQGGGDGIGLAIVRCIAERHGGRAWARSEPGEGSTFFVELPAVPGDGQQA